VILRVFSSDFPCKVCSIVFSRSSNTNFRFPLQVSHCLMLIVRLPLQILQNFAKLRTTSQHFEHLWPPYTYRTDLWTHAAHPTCIYTSHIKHTRYAKTRQHADTAVWHLERRTPPFSNFTNTSDHCPTESDIARAFRPLATLATRADFLRTKHEPPRVSAFRSGLRYYRPPHVPISYIAPAVLLHRCCQLGKHATSI
jgi:hypothetical protein